MASSLPQYYPNDLLPIQVDAVILQDVLNNLRLSVQAGVEMILNDGHGLSKSPDYGNIFSGKQGLFSRPELNVATP
jgi:hypothetical protein